MKNILLDEIKNGVIMLFKETCGYCGVMDSDDMAVINSGKGDDNLVITLEDKSVKTKENANAGK